MKDFNEKIAEILEVNTVELTDEFTAFECWDSLTILSIIAFVDENYNVTLSNFDVDNAKTVGGLIELIKRRK